MARLRRELIGLSVALVAVSLAPAGCGRGTSTTSTAASSTVATAANPPRHRLPRDRDLARACPLIYRRARALVRPVAPDALANLERDEVRSLNFAGCELGSRGNVPSLNVHVTLDTAPEVRRRYDNRITESEQFSSTDKKLFPVPVGGVGDRHVGGGGANWLATFNQLLSVRGQHLLAVDLYVRGVPSGERKRMAKALALAVWRRLGVTRR